MSDIEISELKTDLSDKFSHLCSICRQPGLFISEHFDKLRNNIDCDAEIALNILDHDQDQCAALNETRSKWIEFLNHLEQAAISQLPRQPQRDPDVEFASVKEKIEQFQPRTDHSGMLNFHLPSRHHFPILIADEAEYAQIVMEIIDETAKVIRELLFNQTIFYQSSSLCHKLGTLFYLPTAYVGADEINYLK